jgi:hypothetical protein
VNSVYKSQALIITVMHKHVMIMQYIYIVHDIFEEHMICQQYGLPETLTLSRQGLRILEGLLVQFKCPDIAQIYCLILAVRLSLTSGGHTD